MATKAKKKSRTKPSAKSKKRAEISDRELAAVVSTAIDEAARKFLEAHGYYITVRNGNVVKLFPDGKITFFSELK